MKNIYDVYEGIMDDRHKAFDGIRKNLDESSYLNYEWHITKNMITVIYPKTKISKVIKEYFQEPLTPIETDLYNTFKSGNQNKTIYRKPDVDYLLALAMTTRLDGTENLSKKAFADKIAQNITERFREHYKEPFKNHIVKYGRLGQSSSPYFSCECNYAKEMSGNECIFCRIYAHIGSYTDNDFNSKCVVMFRLMKEEDPTE